MTKARKHQNKKSMGTTDYSSAIDNFNKKSLKEKFKTFITKPQEYFIRYRTTADFKGQFFIIGILALLSFLLNKLTINSIGLEAIISQERGAEYAQEAAGVNPSPLWTLLIAVISILTAYIMVSFIALIYYVLTASCNGKITYKQTMAICSVVFIVTLSGELLVNAMELVLGRTFIITRDPYLMVLIGRLNPFYLWGLVLTYAGIKSITGLSKKKLIIIMTIMVIGTVLFGLGRVGIAETLQSISGGI